MGWEEIRSELLFHVRWAGKSSLRSSVWAEPEAVRERVSLWGEISHRTLGTKQAWAGWTMCVPGVWWSPRVGFWNKAPHTGGPKTTELVLGPKPGNELDSLHFWSWKSKIKVWAGPGSLDGSGGMNACLPLPGFWRWPLILMFHCVAATYASDTTWPFPVSVLLSVSLLLL